MTLHDGLKPYTYGISEINKPHNFQTFFGRNQPLVLDIGAGKGEFVERMARLHPDWNFLCIELRLHRVKTIVKRIRRANLDNVRVMHSRIEHLIPHCFFRHSVAHAYMNFPDPWQKNRQSKNRSMNPLFCSRISDFLELGGIFHFATDVQDYANYAFNCLDQHPDFENILGSNRFMSEIPEHYKTLFYHHAKTSGFESSFLKFRKIA
tara:strand:- start:6285 stop:6905 length:621 start_codon:yes stop_codon:yes gene_type:complete